MSIREFVIEASRGVSSDRPKQPPADLSYWAVASDTYRPHTGGYSAPWLQGAPQLRQRV